MKRVDCSGVKTFKCKFCEETFTKKSVLTRHIKKVHAKKDEGISFMNIIKNYITKVDQIETNASSESDCESSECSEVEFPISMAFEDNVSFT